MEDITEPAEESQTSDCGISSTTIVIGIEPPKIEDGPITVLCNDAESLLQNEKPEISVSRTVLATEDTCNTSLMPALVPVTVSEQYSVNHLPNSSDSALSLSRDGPEAAVVNASAQSVLNYEQMYSGKVTVTTTESADRSAPSKSAQYQTASAMNSALSNPTPTSVSSAHVNRLASKPLPNSGVTVDEPTGEPKPVDELLKLKTSELLAADSCRDSGKGTSPESERDKSPENSDKGKSPSSLKDPSEWEGLEDYLDECSKSPSNLSSTASASNALLHSKFSYGGSHYSNAASSQGMSNSSHLQAGVSAFHTETLTNTGSFVHSASEHGTSVFSTRVFNDNVQQPHVKLKQGAIYQPDVKQLMNSKVNIKTGSAVVDRNQEVSSNITAVGVGASIVKSLFVPSPTSVVVPAQGYSAGKNSVQEVFVRGKPDTVTLQQKKSYMASLPHVQTARNVRSPVDIQHSTKFVNSVGGHQQWTTAASAPVGGASATTSSVQNVQALALQNQLPYSSSACSPASLSSIFSMSNASVNGSSGSLSVTEVVSSILNAYSVSMQAAASGSVPQTTTVTASRDQMCTQHYQQVSTKSGVHSTSAGLESSNLCGKTGQQNQITCNQGQGLTGLHRVSSHSPLSPASNVINTIADVSRGIITGDKTISSSMPSTNSSSSTSPQLRSVTSTATITTRTRPSPPKPAPLNIPKVQTSGPTLVASPVNLASSYLLAAASLTQSVQASMSLASSHLFGPLSPPLPSQQTSSSGIQALTAMSQVVSSSSGHGTRSKSSQKRSSSPGRSSPRSSHTTNTIASTPVSLSPASDIFPAVHSQESASTSKSSDPSVCMWMTSSAINGPSSPIFSLPTSITTALSALSETSIALSRCHNSSSTANSSPPHQQSTANCVPVSNPSYSQFSCAAISPEEKPDVMSNILPVDSTFPFVSSVEGNVEQGRVTPNDHRLESNLTTVSHIQKIKPESQAVSASSFVFDEVSVSTLVPSNTDHDYAPRPEEGLDNLNAEEEERAGETIKTTIVVMSPVGREVDYVKEEEMQESSGITDKTSAELSVTKTEPLKIDIPVTLHSVPSHSIEKKQHKQPSPPSMRVTRSAAVTSPKQATEAQQGAPSHISTPPLTPRASPRGVKRKSDSEERDIGGQVQTLRAGARLRRRGSVDSQTDPSSPKETFTKPTDPEETGKKVSKRKCSENAAELIKACMGLEDKPPKLLKRIDDPEEIKTKQRGKGIEEMRPEPVRPTRSRRRAETAENDSSDDEVVLSELAARKAVERRTRGVKSPQERPLRGKEIQPNSRNNKDARQMRTRTLSDSSATSETSEKPSRLVKEEKLIKKEVPKQAEKNTRGQ